MLLSATDRVAPLRARLATVAREALSEATKAGTDSYAGGLHTLEASAIWSQVKKPDRAKILAEVELRPPLSEEIGTDEALLAALDHSTFSARRAETDAVPGRVQRALEVAARMLDPKVRSVTLERATLRSEGDVQAWLKRQETTLLGAVKQGPVLVN
jgi:hypothetical protein